MNSDQLVQFRQICLEIIQTCEQAELKTKKIQEESARNRKIALDNIKQKDAQTRQLSVTTLTEIHEMVTQADQLLAELKLTPGTDNPPAPQLGDSLEDLLRNLANQRSQAYQSSSQFKIACEALKIEKRKWWKFW
jgi:hypothetical protein